MLLIKLVSLLSLGSFATAGTIPWRADPFPTYEELLKRQDGACTNTPRTRQCWSAGYSISTDFDAKAPPDGVTVTVIIWVMIMMYSENNFGSVQSRNHECNEA